MGRVTTRVPRVRVDLAQGTRVARADTVAVEEPLEIRVGGEPVVTTMRTPGADFDLALGHLLTEGLLPQSSAVAAMMHCTDEDASGAPTFNVVEVTLAPGAGPLTAARRRSETMTSACGVCGSETIADTLTRVPHDLAGDPVRLDPQLLIALPEALREHQGAFDRTGGVHAAGIFSSGGEALVVREDVGRHNAVDKAIGALSRTQELPLKGRVLVVSARASFEIIQKAAVAGIPVVVAVGAPTSLAVALATELGMTLVAFTRSPTCSVYAGEERLIPGRPEDPAATVR